MAKNVTFEVAVERTLSHEAGYVFHPRDPGGETKWGISKRSYPHLNIKDLTREDAKLIYKRDFWDECGAGLDDSMMYQVFDAAVNHGISTAIRMAQRAVGVADDGHWGPNSRSHYSNMDNNDVLMRFLAERIDFMRKLITWPSFGKGWMGRIAENLRYAAADN